MGTFSMSETGNCVRALVASRMDYEPMPETKGQLRLLRHASRHEEMFANDIAEEHGITLIAGGLCERCRELGIERKGIHVEIPTFLYTLVGHLDRRAIINGRQFPVEIKALGRFTFEKFRKNGFEAFPGYAAQEACYLQAEGLPGLYIVGNRDTGELLKYTIPYKGETIKIEGFSELHLPIEFKDIDSKLCAAEVYSRDRVLPDAQFDDKSELCRYCRVKYLCVGEEPKVLELHQVDLLEAARMWIEGSALEKQAEEMKDGAKDAFLNYARQNKQDKFRTGGISVSYKGEVARRYISEAKAKELLDKEILEKLYVDSKPYPSLYIRILKEE